MTTPYLSFTLNNNNNLISGTLNIDDSDNSIDLQSDKDISSNFSPILGTLILTQNSTQNSISIPVTIYFILFTLFISGSSDQINLKTLNELGLEDSQYQSTISGGFPQAVYNNFSNGPIFLNFIGTKNEVNVNGLFGETNSRFDNNIQANQLWAAQISLLNSKKQSDVVKTYDNTTKAILNILNFIDPGNKLWTGKRQTQVSRLIGQLAFSLQILDINLKEIIDKALMFDGFCFKR